MSASGMQCDAAIHVELCASVTQSQHWGSLHGFFYSCCRPEQRIAVVSHCGFLCHGMRALGKSMLQTWNEAMLQQCNLQTAAKTAALGASDANGNAALALDLATAEAVRISAGDVAGRTSTDWMNCELRSIQLCWGPELMTRNSSSGAARGTGDVTAGGGLIDSRRWLWATAGDGAVWFPGKLLSILCVDLYILRHAFVLLGQGCSTP